MMKFEKLKLKIRSVGLYKHRLAELMDFCTGVFLETNIDPHRAYVGSTIRSRVGGVE
jgi:hypothetical protein